MKCGQRSPGMKACPNPNKSPLPEYSIEARLVAPIASDTAASPVFCSVQPESAAAAATPAKAIQNIRMIGSFQISAGIRTTRSEIGLLRDRHVVVEQIQVVLGA